MGRTTFDWRWIIVIFIALVFFGQLRLAAAPGLGVVLLALGGYWAVSAGLNAYRGSGGVISRTKVTYWRGQRIEMPQRQSSRLRTAAPTGLLVAALYMVMGVALWFAALRLLLSLAAV